MSRTHPNRPIAIAGMHRSGTSMLTRALHDSGLHLIAQDAEELINAAEDNPEGFWENRAVVACNDELLEATGGSWDNPPDLPPQGADDPRVAHLVEAATEALAGLRVHDRWGFKDPRVCLTAPFWIDLVPDLHFVVCLRHPLEVALSLKRRNQNSYSLGLALWERYYATVLNCVAPDRRIVSHYDSFFVDPEDELARVCEFVALTPAPTHVRRDLRHHTIEVNLTDAGVSPTLRTLYATLCREAGVAITSEKPADEGRVRRLILDGAVAAQHAEQRRVAIERLEEREREFRAEHSRRIAEHGAAEEALRARVRDLERQLSDTRAVALQRVDQMARELRVVHREVSPGPLRRFTRRALRKSVRTGKRAALDAPRAVAPVARRVVQQLPEPTQAQLRRARRGAADPIPSAHAVTRALTPRAKLLARGQARSIAARLSPPAEERLRITWVRLRRARAAPVPTARRAVQRLPEPTQHLTLQAWNRASRLRRLLRRWLRSAAAPAARGPKAPPYAQWRDRYRALVRAAVPTGASWLVVAPGSPGEVRDAIDEPRGVRFPTGRDVAEDDLGLVAQLEAARYEGHRFLVLPEGSRAWFRRHAEFRDHLVSSYGCLADDPGAGSVFDLAASAGTAARSLRAEVQRLAAGSTTDPAVLAWTDLDIAQELPGLTTFRPPGGERLPYVDRSIEIVVLDDERDRDEARRVATLGVVTVGNGHGGVEVHAVEDLGAAPLGRAPKVLVRSSAPEGGDGWVRLLAERVADAGADLALDDASALEMADHDHDVVVLLEPMVLPLPGALRTASALALACPDTAITGKVLRADGRLDSAGGTVFFDRSVALVAEGSDDVCASWHDYTRPVCWAPGIVVASARLWAEVARPDALIGRTFIREWCAAVWARGGSVVYEPTVAAVRVAGSGGEPSIPLQSSAWQRVLDLRPRRPRQLGDGEWRYLLAHDDIEACRG